MKKSYFKFVLATVLTTLFVCPASTEVSGLEITFKEIPTITRDNRPVRNCTIDGENYYLLRDLAYQSGLFYVDYDYETNAVIVYAQYPPSKQELTVLSGLSAGAYVPSSKKMHLENSEQELIFEAYNIDGYNYISELSFLNLLITVYPHFDASAVSQGYVTYTVQAGDTLSAIAYFFYGNSGDYPIILEANGLEISPPPRVGQILIIPLEK